MSLHKIQDLIKTNHAVALKFSAEWCGPCHTVAPLYSKYAEEHKDVLVIPLDIDVDHKVASFFSITAVPTFLFYKHGKLVSTVRGADRVAIKNGFSRVSSAYPMDP